VHHRDVVSDMYDRCRQRTLTSTDDFEWQKQARFYWRPESEDAVSREGAAVVSITDVNFEYQCVGTAGCRGCVWRAYLASCAL
jgi:dynein heavy chain